MPRTKATLAHDIVPERYLIRGHGWFYCPYCAAEWRRGGTAEGFRKAAATNHVAACYEIVLLDKGYVLGPFLNTRGRTATPITGPLLDWQRRNLRMVRALKRRRAKAGLVPKMPRG